MKISIVIPAYNEEHYLGKCLDSIVKEIAERDDAEVIVVDNDSRDGTALLAARYPRVKLLHEERRGANAARKRGFEEARGELLAFPDADTMMPPGWVARAEREFDNDPALACISGPFIYYDLPKYIRVLVRIFYALGYLFYLAGKLFFNMSTIIQGGNYMVRRSALAAIGGQDANISFYGDDTDLAIRLSKVGNVKFSFAMPIFASGRRLAKEGSWMMGVRYALNNFWMTLFRRPWTMSSTEVRFHHGKTVYRPDNRRREIFIASAFVFFVFAVLAAIAWIAYYLRVHS